MRMFAVQANLQVQDSLDGGLDGRVDVKSPRCSHPDCTKQSIYNMPGSTGAVLCSHHKEPGMVDVVHKLCAHPDCHTQPNYNYPDKKGGVFCSQHKEPGMVDVNNKRCAHPGCNKSAWCNHVGQRGGLFCSQHKMPGMIYITNMLCGELLISTWLCSSMHLSMQGDPSGIIILTRFASAKRLCALCCCPANNSLQGRQT